MHRPDRSQKDRIGKTGNKPAAIVTGVLSQRRFNMSGLAIHPHMPIKDMSCGRGREKRFIGKQKSNISVCLRYGHEL
jgi:hypothetical protein